MNILFCIILYNCNFKDSVALNSLILQLKVADKFKARVYLNGKCKQNITLNDDMFDVIDNKGDNLFLLENYNNCIEFAYKNNYKYIGFLDQDTRITNDYLLKIQKIINANSECVAFYPILLHKDRVISPSKLFFGSPLRNKHLAPGKYKKIDYAGLNSGSILKTNFIKKIGKIDKKFKLDFLDIFISYKIFKSGNPFLVMDTCLEHDLSVLSGNPISILRAESILSAAHYHNKTYRNIISYMAFKIELLLMLIMAFRKSNFVYSKKTLIKYILKW